MQSEICVLRGDYNTLLTSLHHTNLSSYLTHFTSAITTRDLLWASSSSVLLQVFVEQFKDANISFHFWKFWIVITEVKYLLCDADSLKTSGLNRAHSRRNLCFNNVVEYVSAFGKRFDCKKTLPNYVRLVTSIFMYTQQTLTMLRG